MEVEGLEFGHVSIIPTSSAKPLASISCIDLAIMKSTSIGRLKKIGDEGSPCLIPRSSCKRSCLAPGTVVLAVTLVKSDLMS